MGHTYVPETACSNPVSTITLVKIKIDLNSLVQGIHRLLHTKPGQLILAAIM